MNSLTHILVPTDFSGPSRHAVERAARLRASMARACTCCT